MTSVGVVYAPRSVYASSGPRAEWVPINNQRGREVQDIVSSGDVWTSAVI